MTLKPAVVTRVRERIPQAMAPSQMVIRGLGPLCLIAAAVYAGVMPLVLCAFVAVALWQAIEPDTSAALVSLAAVIVVWMFGVRDVSDPATLLMALAIAVDHACLTLAAAGPAQAGVGRTLLARTARRTLVIGLVTTGVWALLAHMRGAAVPLLIPLAALLIAGVAVAVVFWHAGLRPGLQSVSLRLRRRGPR